MNPYDPSFTSSQVAKAAGMSHANFRAYLSRGHWEVVGTKGAKESARAGTAHLFTIYDALGFALAFELVKNGVDPKIALERAMMDFAHSGDTAYQDTKAIPRDPAGLFDRQTEGYTLYVYAPGTKRGRCVATNHISSIELLIVTTSVEDAVIVINLNRLRDRVFASLGLDARDYE